MTSSIFPALIFIVLLNACIIAPPVTENTQATYWFSQGFYAYLGNVTLFILQTELPGVSQDTPISPQFWTLRVEFGLYLLVLLLGFLKEIRGFIWLTGALSLYFILGFGGSGVKLLSAILSFCFGASACHYAKIIPLRNIYMLAAAMIFGTCLFYPTLSLLPLTLAALAYLICWVAVLPVKWMNDSEKYVDPTYGLYLSSFFIGQLLLQYIPIRWDAYSLFGVTMLLGLSYGYFSWHFLEKRMLSMANRRP
jgi:peptidoglycan/LPS O-acetylase OafA/YrhL